MYVCRRGTDRTSLSLARASIRLYHRPVGAGGAGGTMASPDFGRLVNPVSARGGGQIMPTILLPSPGFSDLPTALYMVSTQIACNYQLPIPPAFINDVCTI